MNVQVLVAYAGKHGSTAEIAERRLRRRSAKRSAKGA